MEEIEVIASAALVNVILDASLLKARPRGPYKRASQ
jgi:hypothetical protein